MIKSTKPRKPLRRSPLKAGRKGAAWGRVRAKVKRELQAIGVTICEARLPGCTVDNFLSLAHRLKRRHITTDDELKRCALLCWSCHWFYERQGEAKMSVAIDRIIAARS